MPTSKLQSVKPVVYIEVLHSTAIVFVASPTFINLIRSINHLCMFTCLDYNRQCKHNQSPLDHSLGKLSGPQKISSVKTPLVMAGIKLLCESECTNCVVGFFLARINASILYYMHSIYIYS